MEVPWTTTDADNGFEWRGGFVFSLPVLSYRIRLGYIIKKMETLLYLTIDMGLIGSSNFILYL